MYYDFSIPFSGDHPTLKRIIGLLIKFGYDSAVFNHYVDSQFRSLREYDTVEPRLESIAPLFEANPHQWDLADVHAVRLHPHAHPEASPLRCFTEPCEPRVDGQTVPAMPRQHLFRVYRRVTVIVPDGPNSQQLTRTRINQAGYDLSSASPQGDQAFQIACSDLDIDIIRVESATLPYRLRVPLIRTAMSRGVRFELCYGPALRDASARRAFIANGTALVHATNGKNIILSSDARGPMDVRGTHDVLNLALLIGLTWQQAQAALASTPAAVLQKGASRAAERGVFSLQPATVGPLAPPAAPKRKPKRRGKGKGKGKGMREAHHDSMQIEGPS